MPAASQVRPVELSGRGRASSQVSGLYISSSAWAGGGQARPQGPPTCTPGPAGPAWAAAVALQASKAAGASLLLGLCR